MDDDALWYKDAVLYELHVRAFYDSNGDGIGDFRGLTEKLDYLQDLGVTAVWLLPFYPSPLKDDGYDIADYTNVHPSYGTLRDFKLFLREAHRRGLRVVTELVLNHTSDLHPWFQRARRAPAGSPMRDFYVWSDTTNRYKEARIIFKDFESSNWSWDPVAKAYYWHRFYNHQPDLNFDNPAVRRQMFALLDYWLEMGVDGLRLDAVPYLFEREGTSSENLPETHEYLKQLRSHIDERFTGKMLLAEANQWPEDAVAYFGDGDECHMAFHFPVMPRMFMAVRMEDRYPIIDILQQTPPIPDTSQWALFLRNHDELTLEMVTDEERDYMYRVYARDPQMRINLGIRRRLAPLLGNNRRLIELMNGLLFSLPGTPVIYYGDEIGMGENIYLGDRNGVRTPMQWSADRNAGFSRANPQRLYLPVIIDPEYHAEAINVEAQQNNPHSLLWFMKRLIALRKAYRAFSRGSVEFLYPDNRKILAMVRVWNEERILVVANLSRFVQAAELDLSAYRGLTPVELFGRNELPPIGEHPYFVTLGPHTFYWFALERERIEVAPREVVPTLQVSRAVAGVPREVLTSMRSVLPAYLMSRRWFGGKARRIKATSIADVVMLPSTPESALVPILVEYLEGDPETYVLPVTALTGDDARRVHEERPEAIIASLRTPDGDEVGLLVDATTHPSFARELLEAIARRRRFRGTGEVAATPTRSFRRLAGAEALEPWVMRAEQSNTSIGFGESLVLKLFRRIEEGTNPDLEIGRFLTEEQGFAHIPDVAGALEYRAQGGGEPVTLGILSRFVPNEGDAWQYTLDMLGSYVEHAMTNQERVDLREGQGLHLLDLAEQIVPGAAEEAIGPYLESARLLGERTAELHLALSGNADDARFAPEPFTPFYQRSLYQSMRALVRDTFAILNRKRDLPEVERLLVMEEAVMQRFGALIAEPLTALRIRIHGDYHLGQVLYTGKDFVIIDFEGEPRRSLTARKIKRSPLADVAGMLRSFHYAAYTSLVQRPGDIAMRDPAEQEAWLLYWYRWVSAVFLRAYLQGVRPSGLLPPDRRQLRIMLDAFLLEKAVYEIGYEANNRPEWLRIPIEGLVQMLGMVA